MVARGAVTVLPPDKSKRQAMGKGGKDRVNKDSKANIYDREGSRQEQKETRENSDRQRQKQRRVQVAKAGKAETAGRTEGIGATTASTQQKC